ncbi:Hypothetical protein R9X50_00080100 [Acrodontium crateriforme]|uniref:CT20-domain-containing protein n=1 Tax=Acrodontium crateriforme TaxID=150365 RepID=A0AAQ3R9H3_9PEZI|nr:Hypothetical protein R9X50_00080100 [Acrodontium crateriforme]
MPPRKRARVSRAASPTSQTSPNPSSPPRKSSRDGPLSPAHDDINDPWTDDEEAALFKAIIHHKPTGIHKHFRLLSVYQYLIESGHIDARNAHTRPSGIWHKLGTLYDLEVLDERENARQLADLDFPDDEDENGEKDGSDDDVHEEEDDVYSEAANKIPNRDFVLPDIDFGELKWRARLPSDRGESPPALAHLNLADVPPVRFTPSFSVEPEVIPTRRAGKKAAAVIQKERGQKGRTPVANSRPRAGSRRKSARTAGTSMAGEDTEDQEGEEEEGDDDNEEEEEEDEEGGDDGGDDEEGDESDNDEGDEGTPARSTRAARTRPSVKASGRTSRSTKGRGK